MRAAQKPIIVAPADWPISPPLAQIAPSAQRPMHRPHFCWPSMWEGTPYHAMIAESLPSNWLAPKNPQLHKCQRCGYFVWRARV